MLYKSNIFYVYGIYPLACCTRNQHLLLVDSGFVIVSRKNKTSDLTFGCNIVKTNPFSKFFFDFRSS